MTAPPDRSEHLDRLAQEFVDKGRRGESPSIEAYARAHPDLADDIRELFPVLAVVEGLKDVAPSRPSATASAGRTPEGARAPLPSRVGPWEVVREIGRGGMGSVHEARRHGARPDDEGARVALKVVHPHLLESAEYVARFLREADAGTRVQHENVVRTLGTGLLQGTGDEIPYLVLEYVEGQTLRALGREVGVVSERLCRHVAARLAGALAAIHAAGLVHRDVKPENVVITSDETVKLMDLGVAVLQEEACRVSQTGAFVGSLLYAAPEQLTGAEPDPRWDLYALGVLLYELSTGHHPAGDRRAQWLRGALTERKGASPAEANPDLSPFFDAVVRTLLAVDPQDRFPSAEELLRVLHESERSAWWAARRAEASKPAGALRGLPRATRFYGRRDEWRLMDRLFDAAEEGRGSTLLLLGDAGIGKTRLVHEWLAAREASTTPLRSLVIRHGPGVVGGDLGDLSTALLELLSEGRVEGRLRDALGSQAPLVDALVRHLRGEETVSPSSPSLDAGTLALLRALAQEHVLVAVFEDLHFASEEARKQFLLVARALQDEAVVVVGTTRPVPVPTWSTDLDRLARFERRHLGGLDTSACRGLLEEAASPCAEVGEHLEDLAARSDRNPYFLLEFVRECIRRHERAWRAEEDTAARTLPASIRSFIAARLEELEPVERELLEAAACCGEEFDPLVVAEAADLGRIAALKHFGRLERIHGLLRSARRNYRFQHHLVQEVLYEELHPALRETYHRAIAEVLERSPPSGTRQLGAHAHALVVHGLEGNAPERARPYVRRALEHLEWSVHDLPEAARLAERTLDVEGLLEGETRALALLLVARRHLGRARFEEAHALLEEALPLTVGKEPGLEADVRMGLAWVHRGQANRDRMQEAYLAAASCAHDAGDATREAMALGSLADTLRILGDRDASEDLLHRAFHALEGVSDPLRKGRLTCYLAELRIQQGRLDEAEELLHEAQELAHGAGDLPTETTNLDALGQLAFVRGHYAEACAFGRRSVELARQIDMPQMQVDTLANMAFCLTLLGQLTEARERAAEALAQAQSEGDRKHIAHARIRHGVVRAALGDLEGALEDLEAAVPATLALRRPKLYLSACVALADLYATLGRMDAALRLLADAEEKLEGTLDALGRLRVRAAKGGVLLRAGRHEASCAVYERILGETEDRAPESEALALPYGRALLALGRTEAAQRWLQRALAWGQTSGAARHRILATVGLARLGVGEVLTARAAVEQGEASLALADRVEAHAALWEITRDADHLEAAWRALEILRDAAPAEDREAMLGAVAVHADVVRARGAGGARQTEA